MISGFFSVMLIMIGVFVFLVVKKEKTVNNEHGHFDEMQEKIRSDAFKIGYFVTIMCMVFLIFMMELIDIQKWVEYSFALLVVMMIGIVVFAVYCIYKEAFFKIGVSGTSYIYLCIAVCFSNGGVAIMRFNEGSLCKNGVITFDGGSSLVTGVSFFIILVALLLKKANVSKG